jgi:hypothetical protein
MNNHQIQQRWINATNNGNGTISCDFNWGCVLVDFTGNPPENSERRGWWY